MKTKNLIIIAIFSAVTAVLSQISIPLPFSPVPFSLSLIAVFLTGSILNERHALYSQLIYLILGAAGIPVFAGFGSGLIKLIGPTGGYLISYPIIALLVAFLPSKLNFKPIFSYAISMLIGLIICYTLGTAWLAHTTHTTFLQSLLLGVYPFVLFDLIKIVISSVFAIILNKSLTKARVL